MERKAGHYLLEAADTEGPLGLNSLDNKNLWCLPPERQVIGWRSIVLGFALAVAGADLGKDCSGNLGVAGTPHRSVELGSAGSLGSWGCAVDRYFVMGLGWMAALGDHNPWCWIEEPYHRTSEVTEAVDMCYMQLGDDCKLQAARLGLQCKSSPHHHSCWEFSGLLKDTCLKTRVVRDGYSRQSSADHTYEIAALLAYGHSSEQRSPTWNEDQEECLWRSVKM